MAYCILYCYNQSLFEIKADKNGNYPDEPLSGECKDDPLSHCYLKHIYTADQNETYDMAYQWREVVDKFTKEHGGDTNVLMTEAYTTLSNIQRYYGDGKRNGSHIPFNFNLLSNLNLTSDARVVKELVGDWLKHMPHDVHANWVVIYIF